MCNCCQGKPSYRGAYKVLCNAGAILLQPGWGCKCLSCHKSAAMPFTPTKPYPKYCVVPMLPVYHLSMLIYV